MIDVLIRIINPKNWIGFDSLFQLRNLRPVQDGLGEWEIIPRDFQEISQNKLFIQGNYQRGKAITYNAFQYHQGITHNSSVSRNHLKPRIHPRHPIGNYLS